MKLDLHAVPTRSSGWIRQSLAGLGTLLVLCRLAGAVELPPGFIAETLATNLNAVTALAAAADGRIFIADQTGPVRIWKAGRLLERPALDLADRLDTYWERGLIGLTLAPNFPRTPHCFVLYVAREPFVHHVLSRFTVRGDRFDLASEKVLLAGDDQASLGGTVPAGHQGGMLRFGADGLLLISIGEQTAGEPAQRLDTLQGKILRLKPDGSIPEDNPFYARLPGRYRSIVAYGVRNSFGLAVQAETGRAFFTDVGASAFEEVNELLPGANYGWPLAEGFSTNATFQNPLHAYPPLVGQSIVGGAFVPRRSDWPAKWRGQFLFADFMKHWIRALDPERPERVMTFARGLNGPVATEFAPDGSLLVLNRATVWRDPKKFVPQAGSLIRLRFVGKEALTGPARSGTAPGPLPTAALGLPLDATQLPEHLTKMDWEQRVKRDPARAFGLQDPEWEPFVQVKARAFLPPDGRVRFVGDGTLEFTPGTVFVREFFLAASTERGRGAAAPRLVERRLQVMGAPDGYGVSYRIDARGDGERIDDGESGSLGRAPALPPSPPHEAEVNWWFPSLEPRLGRTATGPLFPVPATVAEWNQAPAAGGSSALVEVARSGWLDGSGSAGPASSWPAMADWRLPDAPVEARVRAYLQGHCAVCHQPGGASRGLFDARITTPLASTRILEGDLAAGDLGIAGAKVVVPGVPEKSILLRRLKDAGFFRMPPTQVHNEPSPIVPVLEEWIRSLRAVPAKSTP